MEITRVPFKPWIAINSDKSDDWANGFFRLGSCLMTCLLWLSAWGLLNLVLWPTGVLIPAVVASPIIGIFGICALIWGVKYTE